MKLPAFLIIVNVLTANLVIAQKKIIPVDDGNQYEVSINLLPNRIARSFYPYAPTWSDKHRWLGLGFKYQIPSTYRRNRIHHVRLSVDYQQFNYFNDHWQYDDISPKNYEFNIVEYRLGYQYSYSNRKFRPFIAFDLFLTTFKDQNEVKDPYLYWPTNTFGFSPAIGAKYLINKHLSVSIDFAGAGTISLISADERLLYKEAYYDPFRNQFGGTLFDSDHDDPLVMRSFSIGYNF